MEGKRRGSLPFMVWEKWQLLWKDPGFSTGLDRSGQKVFAAGHWSL